MSESKDPLWDDPPEEACPQADTPAPEPADEELYPLAVEPEAPPLTAGGEGSSREAAVWYAVSRSGRQEGPMDLATLRSLLVTNEISSASLVWRDGLPEWIAARDCPEIFPDRPGRTAPPPPPRSAPASTDKEHATAPPKRSSPPPRPPEGPLADYEPTLRLIESWLGKPAFFRWTGRVAAALGAVLFIGSVFLWLWGISWFGGVLWCTIVFLVGEGTAMVLESLARIEKQLKRSARDSDEL